MVTSQLQLIVSAVRKIKELRVKWLPSQKLSLGHNYFNTEINNDFIFKEISSKYSIYLLNISLNRFFGQGGALMSATQYTMPIKFVRKVCLNTRFPLPTLLFAEYNVKLIYFINMILKVQVW